jgi:aminotransferase in exopolysaccharide biosynthesis
MTEALDAQKVVDLVRSLYGAGHVPLHRPIFEGPEKQYLVECIDSNFVSSVGKRVDEFERRIAEFVGARFAVATVNGTAALHVSLRLAGVETGDEVLTQALSFVATCNALKYAGATPVFVDVDIDTMGMSSSALRRWLGANVQMRQGRAYNRVTGRRVAGCVPMHTFGFPLQIEEVVSVCDQYGIPVIEDAAESLGSYVGSKHTGTFGRLATLSFNGNKVITTGGGGMVITDDEALAKRAKHLTTTAKIPHPYEFVHDEVGYNYRMPNLNAALGCAQMERISEMLAIKSDVSRCYADFFAGTGTRFVEPRQGSTANHWLNAIVLNSEQDRDEFLRYTNAKGVMTRPIWRLMPRLEMYKDCQHDGLENSHWLEARVVNLPSSVPDGAMKVLPA